jgi:serine/threonine-protein kinase HipA
MKNSLEIEIFIEKAWHRAAEVCCPEPLNGYKSESTLAYFEDYAEKHLMQLDLHAVSCRYPVNYSFHRETAWAPFLLDIMPSGASRRYWLAKLELPNNANSDWELLSAGSSNPPGNIRIRNAHEESPVSSHPGFTVSEIINKNEDFISYALEAGAPVTGSSGAHGDAPKFLLTQDHDNMWHADGALPDTRASKHWIVKFPRGRHESDRKILRNEAEYMLLASLLELQVHEVPHYKEDVLFIPRFDRAILSREEGMQEVQRLGLESLCSACGISEFGHVFKLEDICSCISAFSTNASEDILEFVFRDILNFISGNTDNHGRNSSFLKYPDGQVRLSPLYDFSPMYLDREGIARLNKWRNFEKKGQIDIPNMQTWLQTEMKLSKKFVSSKFRNFREKLSTLPALLSKTKIDEDVQEKILTSCNGVLNAW